jgi:hypothetical protein
MQRYLHKNKIFRRVVLVRRLSWPCQAMNVIVSFEFFNYAGPMDRGIVILETIRFVGKMTVFSDESQIVIGQNNRVYVWRSSNEAYRPECMCPPYHRKVSVMIWGCITLYGAANFQ